MPERVQFRRRWRTTFARGGAALAFAVLLATAIVFFGVGWEGEGVTWSTVTEILAGTGFLIAVPALWLIPAGAIADHYLSRWGFTLVTAVHIVGGVIAFFVMLGSLTLWAILTNQPLGGPLAFVFVAFVPPWMAVGSLIALAVPNAFPKDHGLVIDSARWLKTRLRDP